MANIYRNAHNVLSWLGPRDERRLDLAFQILRDVYYIQISVGISDQNREDSVQSVLELALKYLKRPEMCVKDTAGVFGNTRLNSLWNLSHMEYWSRIWILPEVALAREGRHFFIYGDDIIEREVVSMWYLFAALVKLKCTKSKTYLAYIGPDDFLWSIITTFSAGLNTMMTVLSLGGQEGLTPINLPFSSSHMASASDPKDYIYAFLGLMGSSMKPDYSWPVREVYLEWFTAWLKYDYIKALDIVTYAGVGLRMSNEYDLPSWFAHMYHLQLLRSYAIINLVVEYDLHLDDFQLPGPQVGTTGVLSVYGSRFATITEILHMQQGELQNSLRDLCVSFLEKALPRIPRARPLEQLFLVLFQGWDITRMERLQSPTPASCVLAALFLSYLKSDTSNQDDSFRQRLGLGQNDDLSQFLESKFLGFYNEQHRERWVTTLESYFGSRGDSVKQAEMYSLFQDEVGLLLQCQAIIVNDRGVLGKGPYGTMSGDQICIIDGCPSPMILRKDGDGWVLVGSCWVLGLTQEEVLKKFEKGELTTERFDIH